MQQWINVVVVFQQKKKDLKHYGWMYEGNKKTNLDEGRKATMFLKMRISFFRHFISIQ